MDVEILIHGVPDGHDYYGIKDEQSNMELFYDSSAETVKFVVDTKKRTDGVYVYYSYLRYKGMIGSGGRPGSYFGLTLRIDKYYQDVINIYNLLDSIFKRYVVGTLLVQSGNSYKYTVANFSAKRAEFEQLQKVLIQLIQLTCVSSKFVNIDSSFITQVVKTQSFNISCINESLILDYLKKYSRVALSPDYETDIEKGYKQKLTEAESKGGSLIIAKDKKIAEQEKTITSLNGTISSQSNRISELERIINGMKTDPRPTIDKSGNPSQLIEKIKEPILMLANYYHVQDPNPHPKYGRKNFLLGIVGCGLSIVIMILLIVHMCGTSGAKSSDGTSEELVSSKNKIKELTKENDSLRAANKELEAAIVTVNSEKTPKDEPSITNVKLRIDLESYRGGQLYDDKEYNAKVTINSPKNVTCVFTGKWELTNATLKKGHLTDSQITFQPNGKGNVTLKYNANNAKDKNFTCNSRTFQIAKTSSSKGGETNTTSSAVKTNIAGDDKSGANVTTQKVETPSVEANNSTETVKIVPSTNEKFVVDGKEYSFSIMGYTGDGTWGVDGFTRPENNNSMAVRVKADKAKSTDGKATISYTPKDGKKVRLPFEFNEEKQ